MLRTLIIAGFAVLLALAVAATLAGLPLWPHAIMLGLLVAALLFERNRYREGSDPAPGPGWEPTDERFIDPETGRLLRVWFHPETGERRYVEPALTPGQR